VYGITASDVDGLLAKAELQAQAINAKLAVPASFTASFSDFRQFILSIDALFPLIDILADKLTRYDSQRREVLTHEILRMRWMAYLADMQATLAYLRSITDDPRLPLGSSDIIKRRGERLSEALEYFNSTARDEGLPAVTPERVAELRALISAYLQRLPPLPEFEHVPLPRRSAPPVNFTSIEAAAAAAAPPVMRERASFRVHKREGRYYAVGPALEAIAEACQVRGTTLDRVATEFAISRTALTLMLRGVDAMPPAIVERLQRLALTPDRELTAA